MATKSGKDRTLHWNHRPISLLSNTFKVVEEVILLPYDGTKRPSADIPAVSEAIRDEFSNKETTGTVFLDFANALDDIWHEDLLLKIVQFGNLKERCSRIRVGAIRFSLRVIFAEVT